jgi:hypothetical protein
LLEFIAALVALGPEAKEIQQLQAAKAIGLKAAQVARIFAKTTAAAQKALERTKLS